MAVPSSGQLQLSKIFQELDNDDYDGVGSPPDNLSLSGSSSGQYGAINTNNNASNRPTGTAPHQMSEFYSYDHDATSVWTATWGTIITNISGSKDLTPSNTMPRQTVEDQLIATVTLANVSNDHFSALDSTINTSSSNIQFWMQSTPGNLAPSSSIGMAVANGGDPGTSGTTGRGATGWKYAMQTFPKSPTFTGDSHGVGAANGTWYIRLCNSGSTTNSGVQVRELYVGNHIYTSSISFNTTLTS